MKLETVFGRVGVASGLVAETLTETLFPVLAVGCCWVFLFVAVGGAEDVFDGVVEDVVGFFFEW